MGAELPKQFLLLNGIPVMLHTIRAFYEYDSAMNIIVVIPKSAMDRWKDVCREFNVTIPHQIIEGGEERFHSVQNGLKAIEGESGLVAIHDGVRPLVSKETIRRCLEAAKLTGGAIPVLELTDSLRRKVSNTSEAVNRKEYLSVQTPQCFSLQKIRSAYYQLYNDLFTDDASVYEQNGFTVELVQGNRENIKITVPGDIELAEFFLSRMP